MKRPPPYFPQSSLAPQSEQRYKKFKLIIAAIVVGLLLLLAGIGFGIYYLIRWLTS
jgi:F0F1-type ATP synthase membrane subunit c/vacuolar-type H+-ATPase subunit K